MHKRVERETESKRKKSIRLISPNRWPRRRPRQLEPTALGTTHMNRFTNNSDDVDKLRVQPVSAVLPRHKTV